MLKFLLVIAVLGMALGSPEIKEVPRAVSETVARKGEVYAPGDLIFEDNFDTFDLDTWQHEITMSGGGNWEFQIYHNSRTNSYVRDGTLFIKPTLTSDRHGEEFVRTGTLSLLGGAPADECTNPSFWGCERTGAGNNILNPAMSARIRSVHSFAFKYGRIEVRAKMPAGDWLWPAIWLLPEKNAYGTWPASGEIDLLESRGNRQLFWQGTNIGSEQISHTLHYGPYWPYNGYMKTHFTSQSPGGNGYDRGFHIYGLEWTSTGFRYTLDGVHVGTITPPPGGFWELGEFPGDVENPWVGGTRMAPFDQKFYFLINLAVGGSNGFFPDGTTGPYPKPWLNTSPNTFLDFWNARNSWYPTWNGEDSALQVDYVRVYAV